MKSFSSIVKKVFSKLPVKNVILFESCPDLSDNTKAVFDEFIKRGYNKKYKLVWIISGDKSYYPKIRNVIYIKNNPNAKRNIILRLYLRYTAKCIISCNRVLTSVRDEQVAFNLTHGSPLKSVKNYYLPPEKIHYTLVASENVKEAYARETGVDQKTIVALGYPRNDVFSLPAKDLKEIFNKEYNKIIVWYPTYRQNKDKEHGISSNTPPFPIIHNAKMANALNEDLQRMNILLVVKPHFAQDVSQFTDLNLSNMLFIDDKFFDKHRISSYEFVSGCDALVTDYSSIYYDFTLCDKPIAVIWEDIEAYKEVPGFAVDLDFYLKGAEKIYTLEEFIEFIKRVSIGQDLLKYERNQIKQFVNYSDDGKNAERVADFILSKIK